MNTTLIIMLGLSLAGAAWGVIGFTKDRNDNASFISLIISSIALVALIIAFQGNKLSATADVEIINGAVTSKSRDQVSCRHDYQCNCRTVTRGSGKDAYTTTECDTCYEHSFDVDWNVQTDVGNYRIDGIDRQGLGQPPRWTATVINEPVAKRHSYVNWVKGANFSVFALNGLESYKPKYVVPAIPMSVYDYWKLDRVVPVGLRMIPNQPAWNKAISNALIKLGPLKQMNLILVVTKYPRDVVDDIERLWYRGKKNDVIAVVGVDAEWTIQWTQVVGWTEAESFKVKLRDALMGMKTITADPAPFISAVMANEVYYQRKRMRDFKYLESEIEPEGFMLWLCWFFVVLSLLSYPLALGWEKYQSSRRYSYRRF